MKFRLSILTILIICAGLSFQASCETPAAMQAAGETSGEAGQAEEPAGKPQPPEKPAKIPQPEVQQGEAEITFDNTVHDFGDILSKTKNTCEFKFNNTGSSELVIGDIKRTCGCTVFELSKKNYEPGESGTIKVQYSASVKPGPTLKHLYVPSNAKKNPKVELTIKANIIQKVKASPRILNLALDKANADCPPITLKSIDGRPFKITNFNSTNQVITAEFDPNTAATEFVLQPKVNIEKLSKRLNGHISIKLTHPHCDMVGISYRTPAQFQTNPATIIVQNANPVESIKKQILVQNSYGKDFEIETVYSEKGSMKLLSQKKLKEGIQLELQIDPPPQATKIRFFTDRLYIQIKSGERVQVHANIWFAKAKKKQQPASG